MAREKSKCANPLWRDWIQEWAEEARERGLKTYFTYKKVGDIDNGKGEEKGQCMLMSYMYRLRTILANAPSNLRIQLRLSRSRVLVKVLSSGWNDVLKSIVRRMVYQCLKILSLVSPIWQHYMYACMEYSHFVYRETQE